VFVITRINLYRLYFILGLIIGYVINYPLIRMRFVLCIVFPVTGVFKYSRVENAVYANSPSLNPTFSFCCCLYCVGFHLGVRINRQNTRVKKRVCFHVLLNTFWNL